MRISFNTTGEKIKNWSIKQFNRPKKPPYFVLLGENKKGEPIKGMKGTSYEGCVSNNKIIGFID